MSLAQGNWRKLRFPPFLCVSSHAAVLCASPLRSLNQRCTGASSSDNVVENKMCDNTLFLLQYVTCSYLNKTSVLRLRCNACDCCKSLPAVVEFNPEGTLMVEVVQYGEIQSGFPPLRKVKLNVKT